MIKIIETACKPKHFQSNLHHGIIHDEFHSFGNLHLLHL